MGNRGDGYAKPVIHFAHANGFPAGSYRVLTEQLSEDYNVLALDKFGHNPRFPVNNNWQNQRRELWAHIDEQHPKGEGKIFLVGHSFGAVVSYLAACEQPQRVGGLIMLDPPLVTGWWARFFRFAKHTPLIDRLTPAGITTGRRSRWPQNENLTRYFSAKGLFRGMDERCIQDYVSAATTNEDGAQLLTFHPQTEAALFRTVPHNLHHFRGRLTCPAVLVTGEETRVCVPKWRNRFIRQNQIRHEQLPGGHMFPLEHPEETAAFIHQQIKGWLA